MSEKMFTFTSIKVPEFAKQYYSKEYITIRVNTVIINELTKNPNTYIKNLITKNKSLIEYYLNVIYMSFNSIINHLILNEYEKIIKIN